MATHTVRTVTSTRYEWIVPAAEPWGAAGAEVAKAWTAADMAYRERHGLAGDQPLADDALRFKVTDAEIVISFTVETGAKP
ncbi:hypothetical protein [Streptomyces sp. CBMA152]|uniref:hypothetical protein n=1 Tax=Streptomyces sp. CBMA152 TaxID=1896312 RepID=UPI001660A628|nr:hypothetical protein [Streptomyces sp. CBMA152]MBD0743530.1 hypothetical protein [Streptomyces sp. CBMA152]